MQRKKIISSKRERLILFSFLVILSTSFSKQWFTADKTLLLPSFSAIPPGTYDLSKDSNYTYALGCIPEKIPDELRTRPARMALGAPPSFDWTQQSGYNWMTTVKNQLACGSCVAFGAISAFEGQIRIQGNNSSWSVDLSEQHLFSCGGGSCSGGWYISAALNYLEQYGTPDESCFPYQAKDSSTLPCSNTCPDWKSRAFKVTSWHWTSTNPSDIQAALLNGPLVASFEVFSDFYGYTGGIYRHTSGESTGWHCIAVVGYDSVQRFWKCKNSWGASWGDGGYFKIGFGECSIEQSVASLQAAINTVTFYTDPSSTGSISADGVIKTNEARATYHLGARVRIVANPSGGYVFVSWETSGISVDDRYSQDTYMNVSNNGWLKAHFKNIYQISIVSSPAGQGFVAVDGSAITTPQLFSWVQGTSHMLAANSPVSGGTNIQYVWVSWNDSGAQSHSITVPSNPVTYTATFKKQFKLTVSITPSGAGSLSASSGWQDEGTIVPVTAIPNTGYSFYHWYLDGVNVGSSLPLSVSMSSAHNLTAHFRSTSSMSLGLSSESISTGSSVTLSGTIAPTQPSPGIPSGTLIALSYSLNGATWSLFITTQTDSGGAYSTIWYPPYPGAYQIKSTWSGNSDYEGSTSSTLTLTVTGSLAPRIALLISGPTSVAKGSSATFDILVTNAGSTISTTLYIEILESGGYSYFDAQQITVAAGAIGRFQLTWQVPPMISTGQYQVSVGLIPPKIAAITQTQITVT